MFLSIVPTIAAIIGIAGNFWAEGQVDGVPVQYGIGSQCSIDGIQSALECREQIVFDQLTDAQKAMFSLLLIAIFLGVCTIVFEILNCVTCCCIDTSLLMVAGVFEFLQALCMSVTMLIFPSTNGLNYNFPKGISLGWTFWVVLVGTIVAYVGAAIDFQFHKRGRPDKF
eukprot:Sdes_comp9456_c0_seq1m920